MDDTGFLKVCVVDVMIFFKERRSKEQRENLYSLRRFKVREEGFRGELGRGFNVFEEEIESLSFVAVVARYVR